MKKHVNTSPEERLLVRRRLMDEMYVPLQPELSPKPRRRRTHRKRFAKDMVALAMIGTFMISSVGITYGKLPGTGAFFADTETSALNQLVANLLDFGALINGGDNELKVVAEDGGSDAVSVSITAHPDSVETHYRVFIEPDLESDVAFCNALDADVDAPFSHHDDLVLLNEVVEGNPSFTLTLSYPGLMTEEVCKFDIVFLGWDARATDETGYTDEERVRIIVEDPPAEEPLTATVSIAAEVPEADIDEETPPAEEPAEAETEEAPLEETAPEEPAPEEATEEEPAAEEAPVEEVVEESEEETPPQAEPAAEEPPAAESAPESTPDE